MSEPLVICHQHDAVCWLTLNRAPAMNALSFELVDALLQHLHRIQKDSSVRVLVLTGNGSAFCAGADLKNLNEQKQPGEADILDRVVELLDTVRNFPKPVIAAVNGLALAGGMELMLCCDLIYASDSAKIGDAHCNYGIVPGGGGAAILPRILPLPIAKYLLFTGELLPADFFLQHGLVNGVVPAEQLFEKVMTVANTISQKSPIGLSRTKKVANASLDKSVGDALRDERLAARDQFRSHDFREGLNAFIEKRKPAFKGY